MKVHVDLDAKDIEILDIFCEIKCMTRPAVLRYVWRLYIVSEKLMNLENEQRRLFARQQKWDIEKEEMEKLKKFREKAQKCTCGQIAEFKVDDNGMVLYKCKECLTCESYNEEDIQKIVYVHRTFDRL